MRGPALIHPVYEKLLNLIDEQLDALGLDDGLRATSEYLRDWSSTRRKDHGDSDLADGVEDAARSITSEYQMSNADYAATVPVPGGLDFDPTAMIAAFDEARARAQARGHARAVEVVTEYAESLDHPDDLAHHGPDPERPDQPAPGAPDPGEVERLAEYYGAVLMAATMLVERFDIDPDD